MMNRASIKAVKEVCDRQDRYDEPLLAFADC
jgi:hypothetical protein